MTVANPVIDPLRYQGDQIVVDLADRPHVLTELRNMDIEAETTGSIEMFDISLLTLGDLGSVADLDGAAAVKVDLDAGRAVEPSALEVLMGLLRRRFATQFGRMPRMGKNRDMQLMEGLPHTGGGEGVPRAADPIGFDRRTSVRGKGLRVGILDTAMFPHPGLEGRYLSDDLVPPDSPLQIWAGHAAFVAGRILRRAPGAELDVRQVLSGTDGTASAWSVAESMASFLGSGVQVLNMSLGGFTADDEPPFLMVRAAERLGAEMVVVAAAGNHGNDSTPTIGVPSITSSLWPAALGDVVAVGAAKVELSGKEFGFTAADFTPPEVRWIDVWAPGVDVVSTYVEGSVVGIDASQGFSGYATWSGTSFAAADVTGEIASIAQQDRVTAREALARIVSRPPKGGEYDIRPARS